MRRQDLDYLETMFVYSPKMKKRVKLISLQIDLAEVAESRPDIASYECPGPTIRIGDAAPETAFETRMAIHFVTGATGAFEFVTSKQNKDGLRQRLKDSASRVGLHLEIFDAEYFEENMKHYAAWRQLVRFIHPILASSEVQACNAIRKLDWSKGRISIGDLSRMTKCDHQTTLMAAAVLLHGGDYQFDSERGAFSIRSKMWVAS